MEKRLKKQIFYFLLFISPIILIGGLNLYNFIKKPPSCFDGVKNQGEVDVDCGGPCISCEIKNLKPIIKYPIESISYLDGSHDFFFKVYNPNEKWGLKKLSYSLVFYDENGRSFYKTEDYRTSLNPKESRIITLQGLKVEKFSKVEANLLINDSDWEEKNPVNLDLVYYSPQILENQFGLTSVKFNVYNQGVFDYSGLETIVILYNDLKKPVGLGKIDFSVKSEETKTLEINFPFKIEASLAEIYFQLVK